MLNLFKKPNLLQLVTILAVILTTVTIFSQSIHYFFFQDDWFVLNQTNVQSPAEFLSILWFRSDVIYFRPVGMQLFFFTAQKVFGLHPMLFHLFAFLLHILNIFLIWNLASRIFKNKFAASISTILFSSAAFHYMTLSWLSLTWNVIGTFFFLLTLKLFLDLKDKFQIRSVIFLTITFTLTLGSTEFALVLPLFAVAIEAFKNKLNLKRIVTIFTPIVIVILFYVFCRLFLYKIPTDSNYALKLDSRVFTNLIWYLLWFINLPEVLKYHFHLASLSIDKGDPTFLAPFSPYIKPLFVSTILFVVSTVLLIFKSFNKRTILTALSSIILFAISLVPVLFLPDHSFPYYLSIPSLSLIFFIAYLFTQIKSDNLKWILLIVLSTSYISASVLSTSFTRKTHWIPAEESISKKIVETAKNEAVKSANNSTFVVYPANYQTKQSLMDQYALWVIYNRNVMTVFEENKEPIHTSGSNYINIK